MDIQFIEIEFAKYNSMDFLNWGYTEEEFQNKKHKVMTNYFVFFYYVLYLFQSIFLEKYITAANMQNKPMLPTSKA